MIRMSKRKREEKKKEKRSRKEKKIPRLLEPPVTSSPTCSVPDLFSSHQLTGDGICRLVDRGA
jgi:hypothetical protein